MIEGVMMRAYTAWAVAVRRPDGKVVARRDHLARPSERNRWARLPLVRGIFVLGESLSLGFRALSWSAEKAAGEEEKPLTGPQIAWTMTLAIFFFGGVFILLPAFGARFVANESGLVFNMVEGALRLALFVGYVWAIGRSKEIARVFEYHGAEHMSIHAYEAGEPLSIPSVGRFDPAHPRCGTSFLLIVILGSIVLFTFFGVPGFFFLVISRLLGIPLIAGAAYEILRWSGTNPDGTFARVLATPGLWLQRLTTGPPDDDQIEVAIASLVTALDEETLSEVLGRGGVPQSALEARRIAMAAEPL